MTQAHTLSLEGTVAEVAADRGHHFGKPPQERIVLVEGHGVEGDAHTGEFVRHRYLARRQPRLPNLRQVHLIASETVHNSWKAGFDVRPGELGENITTAGLDLERMPLGTVIELGPAAVIELTGLRTPVSSSTTSGPVWNGRCSRRRKRALHSNVGCWAWCGPAERSPLAIPRGSVSRRLPFAGCRLCRHFRRRSPSLFRALRDDVREVRAVSWRGQRAAAVEEPASERLSQP